MYSTFTLKVIFTYNFIHKSRQITTLIHSMNIEILQEHIIRWGFFYIVNVHEYALHHLFCLYASMYIVLSFIQQ